MKKVLFRTRNVVAAATCLTAMTMFASCEKTPTDDGGGNYSNLSQQQMVDLLNNAWKTLNTADECRITSEVRDDGRPLGQYVYEWNKTQQKALFPANSDYDEPINPNPNGSPNSNPIVSSTGFAYTEGFTQYIYQLITYANGNNETKKYCETLPADFWQNFSLFGRAEDNDGGWDAENYQWTFGNGKFTGVGKNAADTFYPVEIVLNSDGKIVSFKTSGSGEGIEGDEYVNFTAVYSGVNPALPAGFSKADFEDEEPVYPPTTDGFTLTAKSVRYADVPLDEVRAVLNNSNTNSEFTLATAAFVEGGFQITLPAELSTDLLVSLWSNDEIPQNISVSNPAVKGNSADLVAYYANEFVGTMDYYYYPDYIDTTDHYIGFYEVYIYVDGNVTINGTQIEEGDTYWSEKTNEYITEQYETVYNLDLKKGWNKCYIKNEYGTNVICTSTKPDRDFQWGLTREGTGGTIETEPVQKAKAHSRALPKIFR